MRLKSLLLFAGLLLSLQAIGQEIILRHAMTGVALETLSALVLQFNSEQKRPAVKVLLQDVAQLKEKSPLPHLGLLDPEDNLTFFGTRPRFLTIQEVMKRGGEKFDAASILPQMADATDNLVGSLQGLPLALSLPVLYYNKDAFLKAGLDPEKPPKTWWEVQRTAGALMDAEFECPLTSSRFAWVHVENLSSQHGEPAFIKNGKTENVALNGLVHIKHIALLASWHKSAYFHYFGADHEGDAQFLSGKCAMLTGESSLLTQTLRAPNFRLGMTWLPHYDDVPGARPADLLPDGPALWILPVPLKNQKTDYPVIARFIAFLMRPDIQREWVRATGFLPMTKTALNTLKETGSTPALMMLEARLTAPTPREGRARLRFGKSRIREILSEEIAFVWGNTKPAKEALDTAMRRVNHSGGVELLQRTR